MKLEELFNINNFLKKPNTDHQIRHFSRDLIDKFHRMIRHKKKRDIDFSKIFDDEETIKRIKRKKDL